MKQEQHETGSQADELTEMWDPASLREVANSLVPPEGEVSRSIAMDTPSIEIDVEAVGATVTTTHVVSKTRRIADARRKKKGIAALSFTSQLALAVVLGVSTFWIVRLLLG